MDKSLIISDISDRLNKIAPGSTIILYGSVARGESREDSDIDVLILIPEAMRSFFNKVRTQIYDELYCLELKHDVIISPLVLMQDTWNSRTTPFTLNVKQDGILI